jgi:hypothetical protein
MPSIFFFSFPTSMAAPPSLIMQMDTCAAVRAYPWTNGVALTDNQCALLEKWLQEKVHSNTLVDLALV